jgi:hypothetical protein
MVNIISRQRIKNDCVCSAGDKLAHYLVKLMPFVVITVCDWLKPLRIVLEKCGLMIIFKKILAVVGRGREIAVLQIICKLK